MDPALPLHPLPGSEQGAEEEEGSLPPPFPQSRDAPLTWILLLGHQAVP